MRILSCDLETVNKRDDCRAWVWGAYDINTGAFKYGIDFDDMMEHFFSGDSTTVYFHNLAFDGQFILYWLFRHGYTWIADRKYKGERTFTTLISDMNQFYQIEIYQKIDKKHPISVKIRDSLKILRLPVRKLPKAFGLEDSKGEIEYNKERPVGYQPDAEEVDYLHRDCRIVGQALVKMFEQGLDKMTIGADSLAVYKQHIGLKNFSRYFPVLDYDWFIRQGYRGGFTYVEPDCQGVDLGEGYVVDANSLYPSRLRYMPMPYGEGVYYQGQYIDDEEYPLYVQTLVCTFSLKKDKIPTIQLKNNLSFVPTEYVRESGEEPVPLCLTNVDIALFFTHYDVTVIEWCEGFKFKASTELFADFIDYWTNVKIESDLSGNRGMRTIAKDIMNNLYGKFATNPIGQSKEPVYNTEDDLLSYKLLPEEQRTPVYIPVGVFTTAWGRYYTITNSQKIKDYSLEYYGKNMYHYSDTDSIHTTLPIEDLEKLLDIDNVRLGAWKVESHFTRARFLRAKCYIEEIEGELHVTCAGMPEQCHQFVTWENFQYGAQYDGKLAKKNVRGGTILEETTYQIKK